jgi:glycerate kinase
MRVLVAPDKLKGSLTADEAARILADVVTQLGHTPDLCPISDGGEGFLDALISATHATRLTTNVLGPMATPLKADFGLYTRNGKRTAIVEMSRAAGLLLVQGPRDPLHATTFGVGQLLLAAHHHHADEILLGIGGSATVDAGLGLCQAAGHTILRRDGQPIAPTEPLTAADLPDIYMIKRGRGSPLDRIPIQVACDVTAPLFGPQGAAQVFAPQKGATPDQVAWLDREHQALAARCLHLEEANTPGAGAAGGLGWALLSFFNAQLLPGFSLIATALNLRQRIQQADLILTAEGAFDPSSLQGKAPASLAQLCQELNKPCILLAGQISAPTTPLFTQSLQITPPNTPTPQALANAPQNLSRAATQALSPYTTHPH